MPTQTYTRAELERLAREAAERHEIAPDLFVRLVSTESGWNPEAVSPSGAMGLTQLMPATAAGLGVSDAFDPPTNLDAGARFLASCIRFVGGNVTLGIAAYNGGPGAMKRWHETFGDDWRSALRSHAHRWPTIAGYGTAAKAEEVARYLDRIVGPEPEAAPIPGPAIALEVVDARGALPVYTGGQQYGRRSLAGITSVVIHYTAGPANQSINAVAAYQTSWAAATQTGVNQPFPGLAYTLFVDGNGGIYLAHSLEVETWHAPGANRTGIGIVYTGTTAPSAPQMRGLAQAIVWCERQLGRELRITGHRDWSATTCPGNTWASWKPHLEALVEAIRPVAGGVPDPVPADVTGGHRMLPGSTMPEYIRRHGLGTAFTDEWELPDGTGSYLWAKNGAKVYTVLWRRFTNQLNHIAW